MNKKGSIVLCFLLITVLTGLGAALLLRCVNENKIATRLANSTQAFWLAESGLHNVRWQYASNNCAGMVQQGTATACANCVCAGATKALAASVSGAGDFDATLNSANDLIQSVGSVPNRSAANKIQRSVQGAIGHQSPFSFAAFAQGQVTLANNTYIDSYNSNNGAYNVSTNSDTNGDIGSNGTTAGIISIGNNISLGGDVSTGPGGTNTVGGGTIITGTTTHTNNVSLPGVSVPSALTSLASGGVLSLPNNASATLTVGDYKYVSANLGNNTTLNITGGDVRLYFTAANSLTTGNNVLLSVAAGATLQVYVDGVLDIPNNVTISSAENKPKNFQVYSTYAGANGISINNNGLLSAAVYAPGTDIVIGNNDDIYGSLIGKTVSVNNNSAIHYDESLASLNSEVGAITITSWREF